MLSWRILNHVAIGFAILKHPDCFNDLLAVLVGGFKMVKPATVKNGQTYHKVDLNPLSEPLVLVSPNCLITKARDVLK